MFGYRGRGGPRKPAPGNVQCQRCLKRGHYSYECKTPVQDRPYVARPSRTQQLRNPKLMPKLANDSLDAADRRKGLADVELAKREAERAKKQEDEARDDELIRQAETRMSPSVSPSEDSVSTISTNASPSSPRRRRHSRSPHADRPSADARSRDSRNSQIRTSRAETRSPSRSRSRSRSRSYSQSPVHGQNLNDSRASRRRSRSISQERDISRSPSRDRGRSHSYSRSPSPRRSLSPRQDSHLNHGSHSPGHRPAVRRSISPRDHESRNYRTRDRGYPSPDQRRGRQGPFRGHGGGRRGGGRHENGERSDLRSERASGPNRNADTQERQRSLSPFSKRLALTRAMN